MRTAFKIQSRFAKFVEQAKLPLASAGIPTVMVPVRSGARAIEEDSFPFEDISDIAEMESWRKEINRPLSHIHKWWAQRLGTVFRAIVLGALSPMGSDLHELFYSRVKIQNAIVFDPFMGSGTTLTEAVKLGARAIGRDINPVSYFLVKNALAIHDKKAVLREFHAIEQEVSSQILNFYQTKLSTGEHVPVLYYFWVKLVQCPNCTKDVDLFSSYVFAQHAYAKKYPEARAVCPKCGEINTVRFDASDAICCGCGDSFNPTKGIARGQKAQCPHCSHEFQIAKSIKANGKIPGHRMYAKLVLMPNGKKEYLAANSFDHSLYEEASRLLLTRQDAYPIVPISEGYNTNQAIGYNYRYWHEFFNSRQLLCLSILSERIKSIKEPALRDLFLCLFSGALEFNNMFASYKGEGTGAVRHMFSHHILKPERTPLEANLWGTYKSSGSFSTMFESRILRALDYAERPFELSVTKENGKKSSVKVYGLSDGIGYELASSFSDFKNGKKAYISCGNSGQTDLDAESVDAIVTDPPFFDNVHYSQLADFFHVWQSHVLKKDGCGNEETTRSDTEVQNSDASIFTERLEEVWKECHRVLKNDGLLVFTYHHSRADGWRSVLRALMGARFFIVSAHPVKAEMSVATPKQQAKEPINLDIIISCRKAENIDKNFCGDSLCDDVLTIAKNQIERLCKSKRKLSRNDAMIIVMAQVLRKLSGCQAVDEAIQWLDSHEKEIESLINVLYAPYL